MSHPEADTNAPFTDGMPCALPLEGVMVNYSERWTDLLGYMSHALDWAVTNMSPERHYRGVRITPSGQSEPFVIQLLSTQNSSNRKSGAIQSYVPTIHLYTKDTLVVHTPSDITVYKGHNEDRDDMILRYRSFVSGSQQVWCLVVKRTEQTFDHLELCPSHLSWYFNHCARMRQQIWQNQFGRRETLPFNPTRVILGKIPSARFLHVATSPKQQDYHDRLAFLHLGAAGAAKLATVQPRRKRLTQLLKWCWEINESLGTEGQDRETWLNNLAQCTTGIMNNIDPNMAELQSAVTDVIVSLSE